VHIVGSMIRNTRQRQAIQEAFMASSRPLGPLEVLEAGRRRLRGLGIATVYRTVKSLVAEGWLVEVELLWQRLLGGPASENGRLRHRDGGYERGDRRRRVLVSAILWRRYGRCRGACR
jgi:hypothetical protein